MSRGGGRDGSAPNGARVLVCGSRTWTDHGAIGTRLRALPPGSNIIHGGAVGADTAAGYLAESLGFGVERYPADWHLHGKRAGIVRNLEMLDSAPDLVLAFWDGESAGTRHTIDEARRRGIAVEVHRADTVWVGAPGGSSGGGKDR